MIRITRHAYTRADELYKLEIDEEYLKDLNDYLNRCISDCAPFELTEDDVMDIMDCRGYAEKFDYKVIVTVCSVDEYSYQVHLGLFIWDYLNEDLWNSYVECSESEIDDYDDSWERK